MEFLPSGGGRGSTVRRISLPVRMTLEGECLIGDLPRSAIRVGRQAVVLAATSIYSVGATIYKDRPGVAMEQERVHDIMTQWALRFTAAQDLPEQHLKAILLSNVHDSSLGEFLLADFLFCVNSFFSRRWLVIDPFCTRAKRFERPRDVQIADDILTSLPQFSQTARLYNYIVEDNRSMISVLQFVKVEDWDSWNTDLPGWLAQYPTPNNAKRPSDFYVLSRVWDADAAEAAASWHYRSKEARIDAVEVKYPWGINIKVKAARLEKGQSIAELCGAETVMGEERGMKPQGHGDIETIANNAPYG
ncbi:hypothetical protein B0H13DRAFT_1915976 [Mycena leptocephala]|nr:hypothetical protein B0H13DRAFT_1915976 [Mycena leptocephala]